MSQSITFRVFLILITATHSLTHIQSDNGVGIFLKSKESAGAIVMSLSLSGSHSKVKSMGNP